MLDVNNGKDTKLAGDTAVIDPILSPDGKFFAYWTYACSNDKNGKAAWNCICVASIDGKIKQEIIRNGQGPNW